MSAQTIRVDIQQINQSRVYETRCNAYTVIRKPGTAEVSVNGYPLSEGEAYEFGGNIGDFYDKPLTISFASTGTPQIFLIRRFEE